MNNLVFTICSNNYLAQAITLGISLLKHNPDYSFKIGLVDRKTESIDYSQIKFEIIQIEDIGVSDWDNMVLRYNIQELNTAVKPFFFKHFITCKKKYDNIIYLDPDILVYDSFNALEIELELNDIIIIPHITQPFTDDKSPTENEILNTGLYNLGFLAIKNTLNAKNMIDWWAERLRTKGYNSVAEGMFTDQIWINFVPLFYEKVSIFRHPGYDMAYWNMHERKISVSDGKYMVNESYPLVFFHFSGYFPAKPDQLSKYQNRFQLNERKDCIELFRNYDATLLNNKYDYYSAHKCYFSGLKDAYDDERVLMKVKKIPIQKRIVRKFILWLTKRFDIILDYSIFYKERTL